MHIKNKESLISEDLTKKKSLNKSFLKKLTKKYGISKAKLFSFLSFSEKFLDKYEK